MMFQMPIGKEINGSINYLPWDFDTYGDGWVGTASSGNRTIPHTTTLLVGKFIMTV